MKKGLLLIAALTCVSCSKEKPAEPVKETQTPVAEVARSTVDNSTNSYQAELESDLGIDPTESSPMVTAMLGMLKQPSASLEMRKQAAAALKDQPGGLKALSNALAFYEARPDKSPEDVQVMEAIKSERAKIRQ